jgi:hypothetical protein
MGEVMKIRNGVAGLGVLVLLSACAPPAPTTFYLVVRTTMPGGYALAAIQPAAAREACDAAVARYIVPIKQADCADCKIDYSGCDAALAGVEKAMMAGEAIGQYSVSAGGLRMLITGADSVSKAVCEQIAGDLVKKGTAATCVAPGAKR